MMTTDESLDMIDPSNKIIGFLGGMENSIIKDFLVGYIQGAKDIDPEIQVAIAYVGNFYDSASGKDMALAQYQNGADVGFNVAGRRGTRTDRGCCGFRQIRLWRGFRPGCPASGLRG